MADRNAGVLEGQVAVVTGASSGLGQATALALGQAGADVVLLARSAHDLERTAAVSDQSGAKPWCCRSTWPARTRFSRRWTVSFASGDVSTFT